MPILTTLGAACARAWGFTSGLLKDPYFNLTTLLLPGNGTNGAQNNTFLDGSSNNFTITRNGNTTQGTFSPFSQTGWGGYFDGSNDYLSTANTASVQFGTDNFTIEHWLYTTALGTSRWIYDCRASAGAGPYFLCISSTGAYVFHDGTDRIGSTGKAQLNTWQHVAVVRASGTLSIYVNGVLDASFSAGTSLNPTGSFKIGADVSLAASSFYSGYISNFRIVKGVAVYTGNFTPPIVPLAATQSAGTNISAITGTQTTLLTCQSNRFVDNSSTPLTITPNNGVAITPFSPFAPTQAYSAAVGGSGYFDGTGDYLTGPTNTATAFNLTGDFTIEAWIYCTDIAASPSGGQGILSWADSSGWNGWQVYHVNGSLKFEFLTGSTGAGAITSSTITNSQWVHIAVVRSGTSTDNIKFYVNGVSGGSASYNSSQTSSSSFIKVGADRTGSNLLRGYISNARVINGTAVYTGSFTPPTAPLGSSGSLTSLLLNFTNAGVVDATAKNVLETVGNAQISTTQSKWGGGSMYFDGTGDFLQLPASNIYAFGTGDYTVETWVRFTSITTTLQIIFESGSTGGNSFYFHVDVDQISVGTSAAYVSNQATTFTTDQWYHIAACRSNGTLRLYKDGAQVGSSVTDSTNWTSSGSARIGANFASGQTLFGYLDDFRISRFARYTGSTYTVPTAPFPVQ